MTADVAEGQGSRAAERQREHRSNESPADAAARKKANAERQRERRAAETPAEAALRKQQAAERARERRANEAPEATAARQERDAARGRTVRGEAAAQRAGRRAARRVRQLQNLVQGSDDGSDSNGLGASAAGAGPTGADFPPRQPWDLVDAMVRHLHWDIRRPDDPVTPSYGEYLESAATRDWPQRQQDLPEGEPLREIPMSVQVDTAVKLAHVANHHTPDSVCACCSEMVAPVAYTLVYWRSSCFQLLRADIQRTDAVIRPACTVYERSELPEEVPPPPDPVLPVGFTRRGMEQWVKAGHLLPFDQPDHPSKHSAVPGEAAGEAGPSEAAVVAAADVEMRDGRGPSATGGEACEPCARGVWVNPLPARCWLSLGGRRSRLHAGHRRSVRVPCLTTDQPDSIPVCVQLHMVKLSQRTMMWRTTSGGRMPTLQAVSSASALIGPSRVHGTQFRTLTCVLPLVEEMDDNLGLGGLCAAEIASAGGFLILLPNPAVTGVHADEGDDDASWLPRYLPARQCRPDPNDPARVLVPYCMRYETSGPNRTVFGQEDGDELVCICNVCNNALAGE